MANIKLKDIKELGTWDKKELRKLKIATNNRIASLSASTGTKELSHSHPLAKMDINSCKELLTRIQRAEKAL